MICSIGVLVYIHSKCRLDAKQWVVGGVENDLHGVCLIIMVKHYIVYKAPYAFPVGEWTIGMIQIVVRQQLSNLMFLILKLSPLCVYDCINTIWVIYVNEVVGWKVPW